MQTEKRSLIIRSEGMARGQTVKVQDLPMNKIKLGRNSRMSISKEDLSGLMQSINSVGLLEPIGVIRAKDGKSFQIAYGNRRFMAFSKLGLHSIPAVIHEYRNESDIDAKNLVENVQRRNISLAEIGRYASILEGEGLGKKELAVRLGCGVSYIDSCLKAYKEVPAEHREDLQIQTPGKKPEEGKISLETARAIINVQKTHSLKPAQADFLYKAAKSDSRFEPRNVPKYAAAIKNKESDPIGAVRQVKTLNVQLLIYEDEFEKLERKYVDDGPFNSVTALVKAVLRGQKSLTIKIID